MKFTLKINTFLIIALISFQSLSKADSFRARIVKIQGQVYIVNTEGEKREPKKKQFLVNSDETVITGNGSKAVVQFDNGAMSVLDEKSSLRVEKSGWLSQLGGRVYYVFRKILGTEKNKKVKTKFATIGIRGTTFIVDANDNSQQIALQEGKLNIESPGDDYEIYKKKTAGDDFAAFKQRVAEKKQKLNKEFSDYKKDISNEFVEYKKSFELEANKVVSFDGKRVSEKGLDDNWQTSFDSFEEFSKDYIDAYKELQDSTDNMDLKTH